MGIKFKHKSSDNQVYEIYYEVIINRNQLLINNKKSTPKIWLVKIDEDENWLQQNEFEFNSIN